MAVFGGSSAVLTEHIGVGSAKVLTPKPFILAGDTMGDAGGEGTVIYVTRVSDRPVTSTNLGDVCF